MRLRRGFELPEDRQQDLRKAEILEWITIAYLTSVVILVYLVMGSSQAMKVAWIEDLLSLIPPIAFLVAQHFRTKEPSRDYPYGYHRAVTMAFLVASLALASIGLFLLWDSSMGLLMGEHPTIGLMEVFGVQVWQGWLMIAVMLYASIPVSILGRMKQKPARRIHDKGLHADARTNAADWKTGVASILGILGIGLGFWWADSLAAVLISLDITWDGAKNLRNAVADLLDRTPHEVDHSCPIDVDEDVREVLRSSGLVTAANIRLRDMGHVLAGEIYAIPAAEEAPGPARTRELVARALRCDWRLQDLTLHWVDALPSEKGVSPVIGAEGAAEAEKGSSA